MADKLYNPRSAMEQRRHNAIIVAGIVVLVLFNIVSAVLSRIDAAKAVPEAAPIEQPAETEAAEGAAEDTNLVDAYVDAVAVKKAEEEAAKKAEEEAARKAEEERKAAEAAEAERKAAEEAAKKAEEEKKAAEEKAKADAAAAEAAKAAGGEQKGEAAPAAPAAEQAAPQPAPEAVAVTTVALTDAASLANYLPEKAVAKLAAELKTWGDAQNPKVDVSTAQLELAGIGEKDGIVTFTVTAKNEKGAVKIGCTYDTAKDTLTFKAA